MIFIHSYLKVYFPFLILCIVLNHQSFSSKSIGNKSAEYSLYRMNDRYHKAFKNNEISNNHSNENFQEFNKTQKIDKQPEIKPQGNKSEEQKSNIKIIETRYKTIINESKNNTYDKCKCNCSCGQNERYEEMVHLYAFDEDEDPDIDDIEELEQIQKPYKYVPMETIELAHQRPNRVMTISTTPSPPFKALTTFFNSNGISMQTFAQIGISLIVSAFIGAIIGPLKVMILRSATDRQDISRGYNDFNQRFNNHNKDDPLLQIYEWLQSFDQ